MGQAAVQASTIDETWFDASWAMADDALGVVLAEVRKRRPRVVLELGAGRSTVSIAALLKELGGGRMVTIEHDAAWAGVVARRLALRALDGLVELVVDPLRDVELGGERLRWYGTPPPVAEETVDLLLVDGPPNPPEAGGMARYPALPLLARTLAPGALVVIDDTRRDGERRMVERWASELPGWVGREVPTARGLVLLERGAGSAVPG